jgi:hypothetical protein
MSKRLTAPPSTATQDIRLKSLEFHGEIGDICL